MRKVLFTVFIMFLLSHSFNAQCDYACCALSLSTHRISYQYGEFMDGNKETCYYHGGELFLFYDVMTFSKFGWGIKTSFGYKAVNDLHKSITGAGLEGNWYLRNQYNGSNNFYLNAYWGLDLCISEGFAEKSQKKGKFSTGAMFGLLIHIHQNIAIQASAKCLIIYEQPETYFPVYSIGIQWDFTDDIGSPFG